MPLRFRRQWIAAQPYESVGVADLDGDGQLDLASGAWWYRGPDFREKFSLWNPPAVGDYHDDFSTLMIDAFGRGRPDIVTGGYFGQTLFLLVNPGRSGPAWEVREIARPGPIETTRAWDVDGDGELEIVPNLPRGPLVAYKLRRGADGRPDGTFTAHTLWEGPQGHGLGFGDIDGDGRGDFVFTHGWLQAPADPWTGAWRFHPTWSIDRASIPMIVADINEDGRAEVVVGRAHDYGLDWWSPRPGEPASVGPWRRHPIDPFQSQYHDLIWTDIDGDGRPELVTGKRYWAHNGRDPGERDDLAISVFKWTGEGFARQVVAHGPLGTGKGCGIHFAVADLDGDGRPDIVAPGKDGLAVFWNEGT